MDRYRYRITFTKEGLLAYSSHLDLMTLWERTLRRAGAPLMYSQGYNPRPKMQLARALPLGHTAGGELIDVWLEERVPADELVAGLAPVTHRHTKVLDVRPVSLDEPAMQAQMASSVYRVIVTWDEPADAVRRRVERVLVAEELPHERRGKAYDLRPLIERLELEGVCEGRVTLSMQLAARPGATGRPEAVLDVLGMGDAFARYGRQRLLLEGEG